MIIIVIPAVDVMILFAVSAGANSAYHKHNTKICPEAPRGRRSAG
jgi:hypothetical protein